MKGCRAVGENTQENKWKFQSLEDKLHILGRIGSGWPILVFILRSGEKGDKESLKRIIFFHLAGMLSSLGHKNR